MVLIAAAEILHVTVEGDDTRTPALVLKQMHMEKFREWRESFRERAHSSLGG